jgi:hypothetical protein
MALLQQVRLLDLVIGADFRKNEQTLWEEYRQQKEKRRQFAGAPKRGEVYCFVNSRGNQIWWILNASEFEARAGTRFACARSRMVSLKWRLGGEATWSFAMMQEYARAVGLQLPSKFKGLEEQIRALRN